MLCDADNLQVCHERCEHNANCNYYLFAQQHAKLLLLSSLLIMPFARGVDPWTIAGVEIQAALYGLPTSSQASMARFRRG